MRHSRQRPAKVMIWADCDVVVKSKVEILFVFNSSSCEIPTGFFFAGKFKEKKSIKIKWGLTWLDVL